MRFDGRKDSPACGRGCVRFDYAPPAPDSPHPALDSPHPALVSMHIDFDFMKFAIISRIPLLIEPAFREF